MLVLGWHGNPQVLESDDFPSFEYHDSSAAIFMDGTLIAAVEEERLNRVKHSSFFPSRAILFCLRQARATIRDLDVIITDTDEQFCDYVIARDASMDPRSRYQSGRELIAATFRNEFDADVSEKIRFCKHHIAHLYSAWYPSGFSDALVLCLDGDGDGASGLIATVHHGQFRVLRYLPEAMSLGNFYLHQLFFLGYDRFDEYKAMGLAPYGDAAVYDALFRRMYNLQPEGRFTLVPRNDRLLLMSEAGLVNKARRKGEAFTQMHKDYAAALQSTLERIVHHIVDHFQRLTGARRLCISGGVGHNCTLNGKILRSGRFDEIYVQPAAHDAGNALGAALSASHDAGEPISRPVLPHLYLGPHIGDGATIGDRLKAWGPLIRATEVANAEQTAADLLADGAVVGWVQGCSEFGPRALGNRSIIADPRPAANKQIINAMIKKREEFRPFAPAVLEERLRDYFDVPHGIRSVPFMIIVLPVRPHVRELLGAVTHIDGSARVQSVSRKDNPRFHALIEAFGRISGVPVVLNTSFNNNAEPIVDSIDDAVTTFVTTGIHALVIGNWLVRKNNDVSLNEAILDLVPSTSPAHKLTRRACSSSSWSFRIERTASKYAAEPYSIVSHNLFEILLDTDSTSIRTRCARRTFDAIETNRLGAEFLELWIKRSVRLLPAMDS